MAKRTKVYQNTGKKCDCGGAILEIFSKHYGKSNGILGPGGHTPSWVESDGFKCEKCDKKYDFDRTPKKKIPEQIKFELELYEVELKRKISLVDLKPVDGFKKGRKSFIQAGNMKIPSQTFEAIQTMPKKIPPALKVLKPGTTLYMLPSADPYHDVHNPYFSFVLSKDKDSKQYELSRNVLK